MLRKEVNDLLTQTDTGTPMGNLFRQYWIPALLASELPENDCPPVRVELLGEKMIAFRDTEGRYGLLEEFCAHRRVSLWFARNEEGGLRCPYHGWKYDVTGQCIEIPSEPEDGEFRKSVRLKAYSLIKVGDLLWAHMGDPEDRPPNPEWEFATVSPEQTVSTKRIQECNWLQALEGGIDSSHVSFLHSQELERDPLFKGAKANKYNLDDLKPFFDVSPSEGGLYIGVRRNAEGGKRYWRVTQWVMPCFTMIPPRADHPQHGHFWVPINDESCWTWSYDYHPDRPLTLEERQACLDGKGVHSAVIPGTFIPVQNKQNDYLMDREAQQRGELYSGIAGFAMQDGSLQESMGPIIDRSKEHLVQTDYGIVMTRNRLRKAATEFRDRGVMPPGRDPVHMKVRSISVVLDPDQDYAKSCKEDMVAAEGKVRTTV
ncbi:MAG: aromatic ring-hydroxylating dioxygenase subunit alpha [Pseudomonadota bacterium]|nr:aromatic ring-hydroxylating dioxygenase subunit alpha [Pseudomonadota bacterium]